MLKTVWLTKESEKKGAVMLLGGFDGLHLGHCKLVLRAREYGIPVGIMTIVGGKEQKNLFTFEEREDIFKNAGIDFVFELPFLEIKDMSPENFVGLLQKEFNPSAFICGDDFRFGKNAVGDAKTLKDSTRVCVEIQTIVEKNGKKVSSTDIKACLEKGEVEQANALLSEPFFLTGEVIRDRGVGQKIGFPTANIEYPENKFPLKRGVYETQTEIDGVFYKGITNYGTRPTFENDRVITETYLDGFSGELYGRKCKICFLRFLREIKKFENVDALKSQLAEDIRRVREND